MATGLVAGCSSDVMRFQDSILTGDSRPVQPAPVAQAYPGDYGQVDTMSTGSIAPAPRRGGILQRASLVPRPQGNVSAGGPVYASAPVPVHSAAPTQQPHYGNAYPVASQPALPPASNRVTSGPALAPVSRAALDTTITGSTPPRVAQPAPVLQGQQPGHQGHEHQHPAQSAARAEPEQDGTGQDSDGQVPGGGGGAFHAHVVGLRISGWSRTDPSPGPGAWAGALWMQAGNDAPGPGRGRRGTASSIA